MARPGGGVVLLHDLGSGAAAFLCHALELLGSHLVAALASNLLAKMGMRE